MSIRVLLVDDETSFVETLSKRLGLRRLTVRTASSADEAMVVLDHEEMDVVVLDVRMPGTDGIAATRAIRDAHPLVEVILLTGHASLEASMEGMYRGAFDYLLKPVSIDELVYKIEDAYRHKQLNENVARPADDPSGHGRD